MIDLSRFLPKGKWKIFSAIAYTPLAGGKGLRSSIFERSCEDLGIEPSEEIAAAIELFHSGTLVHDDLPEIDNARVRRGKPANHVVFGQGMAVLAGDGLFFLSFELLSGHPRLFGEFSKVAFEVLVGEAMDVEMEDMASVSEKDIIEMYEKKTGALFGFSFSSPALEMGDSRFQKLRDLGRRFGIAFQMFDDVKDVVGDAEKLGKDTGKDIRKKTLVKFWGVEGTIEKAEKIYSEVLDELEDLDMKKLRAFLVSIRDLVRSR